MLETSIITMTKAMQANDSSFDGKFYVGVLSTKIYCLPSCKAKLPLLKNVRFYETREEAIAQGLRGCKRCKSDKYPNVLPDWLPELIKFLKENARARITENDIAGIVPVDISTVRRYFRNYLNTTTLSFHRKIRLQQARQMIESGSSYLEAAFDSGYESSSGFRDAFQKEFGFPPGRLYVGR